ncbi:hypothetical protein HGRIS_007850 [Hohenbuehelia grisea]|uniref:N-acetyltransferase domain-containing protein n=1 Tax=Hohenbuehelia grisea TaxID=104357 RepID=A0ABR3J6H5_9AGAR
MVEPSAQIRPYKPDDFKLVQFVISKANMEQLAVANNTAYRHPVILSIWIALSSVFVQVMGWWPQPEQGYLAYLSPLPAFACIALPIMFLIDWLNRPFFESQAQEVLKQPDLSDILEYYSRSPSSGFWLLELGDRFIGLLALDACHGSDSTESSPAKKSKQKVKGTASTATIRHFFVDEPYRPTNIQEDLLNHAVRFAFTADRALQRIRILDSPIKPYASSTIRSAGFQRDVESESKSVGVLRWSLAMYSLTRERWEARKGA